ADGNKVGKGREEPNKDPFLETPKNGRGWLDMFSVLGDIGDFVGSLGDRMFGAIRTMGALMIGLFAAYLVLSLIKG
ncbi:MAG: hypothetical protein ACKO96_40985, partial [Flammeovirgaceae bacterium]